MNLNYREDMYISLILATLNRKIEVERFLESLSKQKEANFEVIIVDQNEDNRLDSVCNKWEKQLDIKHVMSCKKGLCVNRNIGLSIAKGGIVAFPDDDCVYEEDTLKNAKIIFEKNKDCQIIIGQMIDLNSGKRWKNYPNNNHRFTPNNLFNYGCSVSIFILRDQISIPINFDEQLGVGATYGSAEETDLLFRLYSIGCIILYDTSVRVLHKYLGDSKEISSTRAFAYGKGAGAFCKKHFRQINNKLWIINILVLRLLAGMLWNLFRFNFLAIRFYYYSIKGRLFGYIFYKKSK